jgi:hypothetical protein
MPPPTAAEASAAWSYRYTAHAPSPIARTSGADRAEPVQRCRYERVVLPDDGERPGQIRLRAIVAGEAVVEMDVLVLNTQLACATEPHDSCAGN